MNAFADALDDIFADDDFALAAIYTPPGGGAPVACRVIRRDAEQEVGFGDSRPISGAVLFDVRASEVAPARGGTFMTAGVTYTVAGDPQRGDADKLIWTCTVR